MRMRCHHWLLWGGLILLGAPLAGASTQPADPAQRKAAEAGRAVYLEKCASCHGETATGRGPEAQILPRPPIDLTALPLPFNRSSIRSGITGHIRREVPGGPSGMPYWRGSLDGALPAAGEGVTQLDAILTFLETIQRTADFQQTSRTAALVRAGAPLFATHCTACHGANGRGLTAPDLTTIAARTGGRLDIDSLYKSISRRDHTGGEMPSWDRAFRKAGWPAAMAAKNIEAIARYVESIQQR
jgi:mono/diheme cytochrome c family protein